MSRTKTNGSDQALLAEPMNRQDDTRLTVRHDGGNGTDSLMRIIDRAAMDPTFDVEKLSKLLEVKERWDAAEARKAFVAAMAEFKANPPQINKNRHVSFTTNRGTTEYDHATLDHVCEVVSDALSKVGISHRWETEQTDSLIRVTCVLTHVLGHSERTTLAAPADDSGGKNRIQAIGSAVTYLQRYTLLSATGLAVKGSDNDARPLKPPPQRITDEQMKEIKGLVEATKADMHRLLKWRQVDSLSELDQEDYRLVIDGLRAKQREMAKGTKP